MDKYSIDFSELNNNINAPKRIKLADVQDRIEKIGFGVVRFTEGNQTKLWQIDGDYIVAMYDDENKINNWSVETDKLNKNATIFYSNTPITTIALKELGVNESEVSLFKKLLPERLASNKNLVKSMLNSLGDKYRSEVVSKFPELTK